ncbi:hypothetical protein MUK42_31927 [Musa troglodytarum]|uniref:Uncharacterized protein n=1 Tax=Musa troglodytarum TaxID=320322 RepID=A0A9E7JUB0_9LILI|nr:hypothetical protein MUK42_31927 [Musa troglodytarum]
MDISASVYWMFLLILPTIVFADSCCGGHISGEVFPSPTYFCYPLRGSDGASACEAQPPQLKDISGLTYAAADDRRGGYTGQTPSALQYFCCHKLRGINCCLSTEVGEVQSPQLMVASGIADTNIGHPYCNQSIPNLTIYLVLLHGNVTKRRSQICSHKFTPKGRHVSNGKITKKHSRICIQNFGRRRRYVFDVLKDECADCQGGTVDNESDVKAPPPDNYSKDSSTSGGRGNPPVPSPEGASGPAAP